MLLYYRHKVAWINVYSVLKGGEQGLAKYKALCTIPPRLNATLYLCLRLNFSGNFLSIAIHASNPLPIRQLPLVVIPDHLLLGCGVGVIGP